MLSVLLVLALPFAACGHPVSLGCTRALGASEGAIMSRAQTNDNSKPILVTRVSDGSPLSSGQQYVPGESLTVELVSIGTDNEYLFEVFTDSTILL